MAHLLFANVAKTTLAGGINNTATNLVVSPGAGALFPNPGAGQYFCLTLTPAAGGSAREDLHVTAVSGDTFTIVRGQEGTTAQSWLAGDNAQNRLTAGSMAAFPQFDDVEGIGGAYALDTGTANHVIVALSPVPASLASLLGAPLRIRKINSGNTGATDLAVNGFAAAPIIHPNGAAMALGELTAGGIFTVVYDGANFELQSTPGIVQVAGGGTGNITFGAGNLIVGNGAAALGTLAILDVPRGGTGQGTLTLNNFLIGNGTSPVTGLPFPLDVAHGGTGGTTYTAGQLIVGNGTSALASLATPLDVPHGGTGNSNFTASAIVVGNGTGALGSVGFLNVNQGGTGLTTLTAGAVLVGAGSGSVNPVGPGTAGYQLTAIGGSSAPVFRIPALLLFQDVTTGSHTFTVPPDTWFVTVELIGSGGGGGMQNGSHTGGGGGSGGRAYGAFAVVPGQTISYTIGTPGAGGTAGGDGANGGSVSASATSPTWSISAGGGTGGTSVANAAGGQGGGPGSISGQLSGDLDWGGYGGDGSGTSPDHFAGNGGASFYGGGSRANSLSSPISVSGEAAIGGGGGAGYDPGGSPPNAQPGVVGRISIWG